MSSNQPTQEELDALLGRLGIKSGGWTETENRPTHLPFVKPQLENLEKLRDYLSGVADKDTQAVAQLREQMVRLQRGGGS